MIISIFVPGALSVFWEFSDQEFEAKIRDSLTHPIFAVAHTDYCPHCIGVPEALRRYAADLGDSTNLVFTTINCMKSNGCRRVGVQGVPSFRFIRGPNPRYWVQTHERGLPGWADFLNSVNGPPLVKVEAPTDPPILSGGRPLSTWPSMTPANCLTPPGRRCSTFASMAARFRTHSRRSTVQF